MILVPLLWRYLTEQYLKVFLLVVVSFIFLLLVSRLEEIAEFATLGAGFKTVFLFILYQIPYILPLTIPLSCLTSAMILFMRLSQSHELTAFRCGGYNFLHILTPIILTSSFLGLANFYITSELSTASHLATRRLAYTLTSVNPLLLLQNAKIAHLKGAYIQLNSTKNGEHARDLLIAYTRKSPERLNLLLAKELQIEGAILKGKDVTCIFQPEKNLEGDLFLENLEEVELTASELAFLLRQKGWKIAWDHLKFSLLLSRIKMLKATTDSKSCLKGYSEIYRRISLGLAPLTFTLMGIAFGINISRINKKRGVLYVLFFTSLTLIFFFLGKEIDNMPFKAALCFLAPQICITFFSLFSLRKKNLGLE